MTDSKFGFTVEYQGPVEWDPDMKTGWSVYLPHQCDAWRIDQQSAYEDPSSQADALAALDAFIAEAQAAREALARGEQYGGAS